MRRAPDDDLATAVPSSLTVDLQLPEPVREAPPEEAAVAIDAVAVDVVAVTPVVDGGVGTTSIPISTVLASPPEPALDESEVDEAVAVVPLPEPATTQEPAPARARSARPVQPVKPVKPVKAGRRPAPEGAWPALVYAATLHLVNLGDSAPVRARKALDARIGRALGDRPRFVPVLSRKGGVGATTVTTLLGMALADVRDDRVVAIDANPDRGTLGDRVPRQTPSSVRDIVLQAPDLIDPEALAAHLSRDVTGLEVAASDSDPLLADVFDEGGYHVVADVVAPHAGIVITDGGTGVVHSTMRAALQRADGVVVVSGGGIDEARLASEVLTWLEANGHAELAANAVVALNTSTQGTDLDHLYDIEQHFRSRVRAVVRIPYDPGLAAGSVVRYDALRPFTRDSARDLAASVVDGLPGVDT